MKKFFLLAVLLSQAGRGGQPRRGRSGALADAEIQQKMRSQFYDPKPGSAEDTAAFVRSEVVKWGRTIREASIKAD